MKNKKNGRRILLAVEIVLVLAAVLICFLVEPRTWVTGKGSSWALGNFALMNIAVFTCVMLLLGGNVTVTRKENQEAEENAVDVRWLPRLLSIPVMAAAVALFILVENIDLRPLVWFDRWTWLFAVLAAGQLVLTAMSRKVYPKVR